jgi:hypothetical protein
LNPSFVAKAANQSPFLRPNLVSYSEEFTVKMVYFVCFYALENLPENGAKHKVHWYLQIVELDNSQRRSKS